MIRPAAIIFDLDDTLVARPGRAQEAWTHAIADLPELTARHEIEAIMAALDAARGRAWSIASRRAGPALDYAGARAALVEDALACLGFPGDKDLAVRLNEGISRHQGRSSYLTPGGIEVLTALRRAGFPMALLTNGESRTQRGKIERFALASYFEHIFVEEEIGAGKPFDGAYLTALDRFGHPARDIWMIGDHLVNDIAAPKRHGMRTVWFNPDRAAAPDDPNLRADREIAALAELMVLFGIEQGEGGQ